MDRISTAPLGVVADFLGLCPSRDYLRLANREIFLTISRDFDVASFEELQLPLSGWLIHPYQNRLAPHFALGLKFCHCFAHSRASLFYLRQMWTIIQQRVAELTMKDVMLVLAIGGSNLDREVFDFALEAYMAIETGTNPLLADTIKPTFVVAIRKDSFCEEAHSFHKGSYSTRMSIGAHKSLQVLNRHGARWLDAPDLASTIARSGDIGLLSQNLEVFPASLSLSRFLVTVARYGHFKMCVWLSKRVRMDRGIIARGLDCFYWKLKSILLSGRLTAEARRSR